MPQVSQGSLLQGTFSSGQHLRFQNQNTLNFIPHSATFQLRDVGPSLRLRASGHRTPLSVHTRPLLSTCHHSCP